MPSVGGDNHTGRRFPLKKAMFCKVFFGMLVPWVRNPGSVGLWKEFEHGEGVSVGGKKEVIYWGESMPFIEEAEGSSAKEAFRKGSTVHRVSAY